MESQKHEGRLHEAGAWQLVAAVMKALASPVRLRMLDALEDSEQTVGELAERLVIHPSVASQHLQSLRHAGLVESARLRNHVFVKATARARKMFWCSRHVVACIQAKA